MAVFHTTRWSLVLAARDQSGAAQQAFAELCTAYRAPVLSYVRRCGHSTQAAEDLTQAFFLKLLEKRYDADADPRRGRFRMFLLTVLKRFLANAYDAATAAKRGGAFMEVTLDASHAESLAADADQGPQREFERAFALAVFQRALGRLHEEAQSSGKAALFQSLREFLLEAPEAGRYEQLASVLDMRANTIAVTVRRLRERLIELIRREVAETVADPADIDSEMQALRGLLGGA